MTVRELRDKLQALECARDDDPVYVCVNHPERPDDAAHTLRITGVTELEDAGSHEIEVWIEAEEER